MCAEITQRPLRAEYLFHRVSSWSSGTKLRKDNWKDALLCNFYNLISIWGFRFGFPQFPATNFKAFISRCYYPKWLKISNQPGVHSSSRTHWHLSLMGCSRSSLGHLFCLLACKIITEDISKHIWQWRNLMAGPLTWQVYNADVFYFYLLVTWLQYTCSHAEKRKEY